MALIFSDLFKERQLWASWKPPKPCVMEPVSGVITTTGEWAQKAAAVEVT